MNFIFEEVNKDQLNQYDLQDFNPSHWVIDKEEDTFLFGGGLAHKFIQQIMDESEFVNDYVFYLWLQGDLFEAHLAKGSGTLNKKELKEGEPWLYVWDKLLSMTYRQPQSNKAVGEDKIAILKEALATYGGGVDRNRTTPYFTVKFNF